MTNSNPEISIVMYDGGYRERLHLIDCLDSQTLSNDMYEMIWVDYYDKPVNGILEKETEIDNLTVHTLDNDDLFFVAKCWNEGIKQSQGNIVMLIDADLYVEDDFLETILDEHERNSHLALYFNRFNEPRPSDGSMKPVELSRLKSVCEVSSSPCYGACLSTRKKWLEEVNGYEEHPVMAGRLYAGATELNTRLRNYGLDIKWYPDKHVYHPWHPTEGYQEQKDHRYPQKFRKQARFKVIEHRQQTLEYKSYRGLDTKEYGDSSWIDEYYQSWESRANKRKIKNGLRKIASHFGLLN